MSLLACLLSLWNTYCRWHSNVMLCTYSTVLAVFSPWFAFFIRGCVQYWHKTMCLFFHCARWKSTKMPKMSINYGTTALSLLFATMLFSTFPPSRCLCRQPRSSKRQKYAGRKIILRSWFHVQFTQWYMMVGLKAKAREHSSNSLPATTNGI